MLRQPRRQRRTEMASGNNPATTFTARPKPSRLDSVEVAVPSGFRCPISLELMTDPVTLPTGITYDRESIERWLDDGNAVCPVSHQPLLTSDLIPNHALRRMIQSWCVENRSLGVERIPTPRIPASRFQVAEMISELDSASRHGRAEACGVAAGKIMAVAKEGERSRRCAVDAGAAPALAAALGYVCDRFGEDEGLVAVENIASAMVVIGQFDDVLLSSVSLRNCLRRVAGMLRIGNPEGRRSSAVLLKEVSEYSGRCSPEARKVVESPEVIDGLVRLVKEPICPEATRAALSAILSIISGSDRAKIVAVSFGAIEAVVETIGGGDHQRGVCEKALALLDAFCRDEDCCLTARQHALTVPAVVKRMLRVSEAATELAVSALWRLSSGVGKGGGWRREVVEEAVGVGAFQKLLLLLQVGCGRRGKEKATELLRWMNGCRDKCGVCIDSTGFKELKKSF